MPVTPKRIALPTGWLIAYIPGDTFAGRREYYEREWRRRRGSSDVWSHSLANHVWAWMSLCVFYDVGRVPDENVYANNLFRRYNLGAHVSRYANAARALHAVYSCIKYACAYYRHNDILMWLLLRGSSISTQFAFNRVHTDRRCRWNADGDGFARMERRSGMTHCHNDLTVLAAGLVWVGHDCGADKFDDSSRLVAAYTQKKWWHTSQPPNSTPAARRRCLLCSQRRHNTATSYAHPPERITMAGEGG